VEPREPGCPDSLSLVLTVDLTPVEACAAWSHGRAVGAFDSALALAGGRERTMRLASEQPGRVTGPGPDHSSSALWRRRAWAGARSIRAVIA
jgi:hypothetical protein